ncbi:MAG: hypothetical protein AAF600_20280 [Bacteroidota bacterium]
MKETSEHSKDSIQHFDLSTREGFTKAYYAFSADMLNICYSRFQDKNVTFEIVQDIFFEVGT